MNRKKTQFNLFPLKTLICTRRILVGKTCFIFPGKTQSISVPRRKKLAKFIMVLKEPSFFKVLPLTHVTHYKLPFRSIFLPKIWEVFAYCPKNPEKINISLKNLFFLKIWLWLRLMLFCKYGQKFFGKRAQNLLPKTRNWQNIPGVFRDTKSFQLFFWTFRMQFTQCCGKTLVKIMKKYRSEAEILETCLTFSKLIASKSFSEPKTCSFNKPAVVFLPEVKRNISQKPKKFQNFQAKSENVPVGTPIAV